MVKLSLILGGVSCTVEGCGKPVESRGWCRAHYRRYLRHGSPLGGRTAISLPAEFLRQAISYNGDECLLWPFSRNSQGYATIKDDGHTKTVARMVCEAINGPAPLDKPEAAHSCGKGLNGCVAGSHLRWASRAENTRDKIVHGTEAIGARNGRSKLREEDVRLILEQRDKPRRAVAEKFGITVKHVGNIQNGKNWRHLAGETSA